MRRRSYDGMVIYCQECGGPWGVLGPDREADLIDAFDVWWAERCVKMTFPNVVTIPPPHDDLPAPATRQVFWMAEGDGRWLVNIGHEPEVGDLPCWNVYHRGCAPEWWLDGRTRPATTWDCCSGLPIPEDADWPEEVARD